LSRIASVNCGSPWSQTFTYDPFGNITKSGSITWQPGYTASTNRYTLAGTSYDSNGNLLNDSFHGYGWDSENKPVTIDSIGLTYDAFDRVVEQNQSGTYYQIVYTPMGTKLGLFKATVIQQLYVPLPGGAQAEYLSWGLSHYRHVDWLGSNRLETSSSNHSILDNNAYAPFGEPYAQTGNGEISFTGQSKDTVWLQYDFLARQYDPKQGRWLSPDPAGLGAVNPGNPQTWNRYAYVANNPLSSTDPLGLVMLTCELIGTCPAPDPGPTPWQYDSEVVLGNYCDFAYWDQRCLGLNDSGPPRLTRKPKAPNNTTCPSVPQAPPGANVNSNIKTAQLMQVVTYTDPLLSLYVFKNTVGNKMPWDYKQQGWTLTDTGQLGPSPFQDFGNFNFGATGAAWGISLDVLQRGAGYAQGAAGTSTPEWGKWYQGPPHGDDPADQAQINAGYQYYQNGCYEKK
jgi:RHS repeat-associated protein